MNAVSLPSLVGRRIAVTRGSGGEDALSARLRELGADVFDAPAIVIAAPPSTEELDVALRELGAFDWIVFASANAVERTVSRAAAIGVGAAVLARPRLAVVGAATARRLEQLVRAPDLVPAVARGDALAAALAPSVVGRRVLVPRAAEGRPELVDGLARAGAEVIAPVAYTTIPATREMLEPLHQALASQALDAVLFASPSAVRSVAAALGAGSALLAGVVLGAIGATTAAAMRELGLTVAVQPLQSTGAAFADAVAERLGPRKT